MTIGKLNDRLSKYLDSLYKSKIQKTAVLGNFGDVKNPEEMSKVAKMTDEMLSLPKYQPIMSKLKGSTGIVNFVTHDEYQPLIELMLKKVFPLNNNDVFNMGQQEASGEEYFISPEFFSKNIIQGDPKSVIRSREKLESLLLGSKAKITRKWLKEVKNFTDEEILEMLGSPNQDAAIAEAMEAQARGGQSSQINQLGVAVTMYERRLEEIKEKYDNPIRQINKEILEHNLGERVMKPEDLAKKKEQRDIWIGLKRAELENLDATIGAHIVVEKWYPGKSERNSDGFITFNPTDEAIEASYELAKKVQANRSKQDVLRAAMMLKQKLEDFQTSNPKLQQIKEKFMEFLGNGEDSDYTRIMANIAGMYMQLQHAFASSVKKQGRVLILDDFDKSALCSRMAARDSQSVALDDVSKSVFLDFVGRNASNLERDDTQGKRERGNRVIVVLSSEKISNLPASTVIEMDVSPVDIEEAEIIVRNILGQYSKDALMNLKRRLHREIDEKYGNKSSPEKGFEKETINERVESQAGTLGNLSDETKKRMIGMIIGLSQREAVNAVRMAIQSGIKYEEEDVISPTMAFEEKEILKNLRDTVNTRLSTDVMGLTVIEPEVAFEDYAYNRTSEWANRVMSLKDVRDEMVDIKECIKLNEQRIANIDRDIKISNKLPKGDPKKYDDNDIKALLAERQGLVNQTAHYRVDLNSIASNDLPHVYVLYGPPGVGKCFAKETPILLFNGDIKNVEDIVVGDVLMGPDSKPRKVLSTTRGIGPLYRVSQKLGEDYICNDAHILSLQNTFKPSDQSPVFISAQEYCQKSNTWKHDHKGWKVGVEFEEQDLPIDPYWMGLWLGDGDSRIPSIMVANKDKEIGDWLKKWAKDNKVFIRKQKQRGCEQWNFTDMQGSRSGCTSNHIKTKLRNLNLLENKHIPNCYFKNSSSNRLLLLAGLIDSDGYKCKSGSLQYCSVNKGLANDVLRLARSLGFRVTFSESIKGIKKLNYTVKAYTVTIGGTLSRIPSQLPRKQGHNNPQKKSLRYAIDVNPIGNGEYFGFTIDGDHQFLLGDFTVTHNSIWAHALASLLKLNIRSVDIGAQKDMWLGNTEKNCIRLFNTMKDSRDTIYLIDEIDRQVEMGSSQGPSTHETTKEIVSRFLDLFDNTENERKFRQNNVFFIMTTNNIEEIDTALLQRVSETYEVQLPDRPEDYEKFFRSYLNVERGRFPDDPWFCDEDDTTTDECWTSTMEMLNSMDWKRISTVFAQKRIDFRSLKKMLQQAFNEHRSWRIRSRMIGKGKVIEPRGIPLTTENLIDVGNIISTAADSNDSFKLGVGQLASERAEEAKKMLEPYVSGQKKLETTIVKDPHTGKEETRYKLPDEIMKIMRGESRSEKEAPQENWEYKKEIDPETGQVRTELKPKLSPAQEMEELKDKGFQELPLVETPQEKQSPVKEKSKEKKKKEDMQTKEENKDNESITSSTDYFFDYLNKKGFINDNRFVAPTKKEISKVADFSTQKFQNNYEQIPEHPEDLEKLIIESI